MPEVAMNKSPHQSKIKGFNNLRCCVSLCGEQEPLLKL